MATLILKKYGTSVSSLELIPSSGGVFEVYNEQKLVFSKKNEGRFPDENEVVKILEKFN